MGRFNVNYSGRRRRAAYNQGDYRCNFNPFSSSSMTQYFGNTGSNRRRIQGPMRFYSYTANQGTFYSQRQSQNRAPEPDPSKTLMVQNVDLNLSANGEAHHTSEYDISSSQRTNPILVVRRGQPFNLSVTFNRSYNPKKDDLKLIFVADDDDGPAPSKAKGTLVEMLLSDKDEEDKWGAKILSNKRNDLTMTIFTPPDVFVGGWKLSIDVVEKDGENSNVYSYEHPAPIYVIFNPWCKRDTVYLDDEELLKEYILNETGKIFSGSKNNISAKPWNFAQFDHYMLDIALYLLKAGGLKWTARGNAIAVVRKLTAMVNSSDDGGVLEGNWSGNYEDGVSPLKWAGSRGILNSYWFSKKPVKYGQCWVFSGITTTLMRALGIPARSVTNFASAHDTDGSISIDFHFDLLGEPDSDADEDSIWNFHVWNEVWMSRPDLPSGYGGWQAVDATPQETSDGIYVCGPVSVQAVKQGEVNLPYDACFVFAEVNADICDWFYDNGEYRPLMIKSNVVGQYISTKAPNSDKREDITHQYKPPENSAEERAAVLKANLKGSTKQNFLYDEQAQDLKFSVEQDAKNTWVGQDFVISLRITNTSNQPRLMNGRCVIKTMMYTGVTCEKLLSEEFSKGDVTIRPGEETVHKVVLKASDYVDKLKDCCMLDVNFWAAVKGSNQVFTFKDDYRLRKPHLTIKAPKESVQDKQFMIDVSFVNPFDRMLTDCVLEVDGLSKDYSFPQGNVSANGTFSTTIPVTAAKKGQKEIIIIFNSKQLEDVNGTHPIFIRAA